jgi:hypothetical protein
LLFIVSNNSIFEPETTKLHSVNPHYHLLDCVCSTHQQTSLQLLSSMIVIKLLLSIVIAIQVKVSSLIVFYLPYLCHYLLRPHNLPHPPSSHDSPQLLHYLPTTMILLSRKDPVYFEWPYALPHIPPPVQLLYLGRTLVHVDFKHLLAHTLNLYETISEALGDVKSEKSFLITFE